MQELNEQIIDLTNNIDEILKELPESTDSKTSRNKLIFVREKVIALVFEDEKKKELLDKINSGFELLNIIIEKSREEFNVLSDKAYNEIKPRVDEVLTDCKEQINFKECRDKLIVVQNEIKKAKLKKDQKELLIDNIQQAFVKLRDRQDEEHEKYEMECSDNYLTLKAGADRAIAFAGTAERFSDARRNLISAQKEIKGKLLKRDKRDELYESIRESFNLLNERQDSEREQFDKITKENFSQIKVVVENAIGFAKSSEMFKDAREALISAQKEIKNLQLKRTQRDELYGGIRVVFNELNERQNAEREVFDEEAIKNYEDLLARVKKATEDAEQEGDFRVIRENLIALQDEVKIMKMRRDQRNELFKMIRLAFGIFDNRRDEYKDVLRVEKNDKLKSILQSLNFKADRLREETDSDNKDILEKTEKRIADIKQEIESK